MESAPPIQDQNKNNKKDGAVSVAQAESIMTDDNDDDDGVIRQPVQRRQVQQPSLDTHNVGSYGGAAPTAATVTATGDRPPRMPRRRNVTFGHVYLVEFPSYCLSTSSVCNSGAPISLATAPMTTTTTTTAVVPTTSSLWLEDFESYRPQQRRSKNQLYLSVEHRQALLLESGMHVSDISRAVKETHCIRRERAETLRELRSLNVSRLAGDEEKEEEEDDRNDALLMSNTKRNSRRLVESLETNIGGDDAATSLPAVCLSPVVTSPIKLSRKWWSTRAKARRPRDSLSPRPMISRRGLDTDRKIVAQLSPPSASFQRLTCSTTTSMTMTTDDTMETNDPLPPKLALSPTVRPLKDRTKQQPSVSIPMPRLTPKRKRHESSSSRSRGAGTQQAANGDGSVALSPRRGRPSMSPRVVRRAMASSSSLALGHKRMPEEDYDWSSLTIDTKNEEEEDDDDDEKARHDGCFFFASPPKRQRTPTKVDPRPLVLPSRTHTPPPSPLVSSRVLYR